MPDRPLREAVALRMGYTILDRSELSDGKRSLGHMELMRAHPSAGGCLLNLRGREVDFPSADYSGVPAMEAWCADGGWRIAVDIDPRRTGAMQYIRFTARLSKPGLAYNDCPYGPGAHYAEALARAIVETGDAD